jgi:hypothetical protein
MKCPHCAKHFHVEWVVDHFKGPDNHELLGHRAKTSKVDGLWKYRTAICPACEQEIIHVGAFQGDNTRMFWWQVYPVSASRGPVPPQVPAKIAEDYIEACNVLRISAKASAALSRRCLQHMLHDHGYKHREGLGKEIDLLLNEEDRTKAIPVKLRTTIDAIRNFGNFSAHPIDDKSTLQIIEVEPHEAEWCLEVIEECFEHFYVGPAEAQARKDALNEKLLAAKKPLAK